MYVFRIILFCSIINVFVTFDQFNVSLFNTNIKDPKGSVLHIVVCVKGLDEIIN